MMSQSGLGQCHKSCRRLCVLFLIAVDGWVCARAEFLHSGLMQVAWGHVRADKDEGQHHPQLSVPSTFGWLMRSGLSCRYSGRV